MVWIYYNRECGCRVLACMFISRSCMFFLCLFPDEHIQIDDSKMSDHFENIQSTNWQTVRFKPPAPGSPIGWRVEFRTMEVQLTDFENAAFTVFVALVSRALLFFNLNFYIPLSKVDDNLKKAHTRNAVLNEKFWWRSRVKHCSEVPDNDDHELMSLTEILMGKENNPGLIPLVKTYLDMIECDETTRKVVDEYLDLIALRAKGELMTAATWMRKFISVHPAYQHDSLLNDSIVHDLIVTVDAIAQGKLEVPQLLGKYRNVARDEESNDNSRVELRTVCRAAANNRLDFDASFCCMKMKEFLSRYQNVGNTKPEELHGV